MVIFVLVHSSDLLFRLDPSRNASKLDGWAEENCRPTKASPPGWAYLLGLWVSLWDIRYLEPPIYLIVKPVA